MYRQDLFLYVKLNRFFFSTFSPPENLSKLSRLTKNMKTRVVSPCVCSSPFVCIIKNVIVNKRLPDRSLVSRYLLNVPRSSWHLDFIQICQFLVTFLVHLRVHSLIRPLLLKIKVKQINELGRHYITALSRLRRASSWRVT